MITAKVSAIRNGMKALKPYKSIAASGTALSVSALLSLAVLGNVHAEAAGLGGDCCVDLEERIAELEATTVRRGNRNVQLSISGQVSQAIVVWDDGAETNVYQVANSNSSDRFRFDGRARISRDLFAGFLLEFNFSSASSASFDQFNDDRSRATFGLRRSLWYLRSRRLGAVSVGLAAPASDDIINYNLGRHGIAGYADTRLVGSNLLTRDSTVAGAAGLNSLSSGNTISLRWRRFLPQLDTPRANLVRYDTPVFAGFTASVSWGENDFWDVALRHAGRIRDFKYVFGVGYFEGREEEAFTFGWPQGGDGEPEAGNGGTVIRDIKASGSVIHRPTGLFASAAYVHREFSGSDLGVLNYACFPAPDAASLRAAGISCANRPDFDYFYVSAGVKRRFLSIGSTSVYGEYARSYDAITGINVAVSSANGGDLDFVTDSDMEIWGFGVVQSIRPAAMDLYFSYRHFSADVVGLEASGQTFVAPLEDADIVYAGSRIRF